MNENFEETLKKKVGEEEDKNSNLDLLLKMNQARKTADSKFGSFVLNVIKIMPLIIINILALFIIGLDNFVKGQWTWTIFLMGSFWYSYFSFQSANWLVAISYLVNAIKKFKQNHKVYLGNLDKIQDLVNQDHDKPFINKQVEIERLSRKKDFLEMWVYNKMYVIFKRKTYITSVDEFLHQPYSIVAYKGKNPLKLIKQRLNVIDRNKTHRKLTKLKAMLGLEWQKKHLQGYRIKFPKISRALLVSGFNATDKQGKYNTYQGKVFSTTVKMIAPNTITTSIIGLVLLAFQFVPKDADETTWLKFVIQIFLILMNTILTLSLTGSIFEYSYLRPSEERRSDLEIMSKRQETGNPEHAKIIEIIKYNEDKLE